MVLCFGGSVLALDFMGPPTATLKQGQWKTDFTYFYSEADIELTDITIFDFNFGDLDADDLEVSRYYANFTYGLDERVEVYAKIGGIDVEQSDSRFDSSADLTYGWGTRITTNKSKAVDWGVGFLMSWLNADDSYSVGGDDLDVDFDAYELQVAAGPTFKFRGWKLYGGVFYYMLDGDVEFRSTSIPLDVDLDAEEDSNVGGYIGTLMHLTKNMDAMVEVAGLSDGWGIGGNIAWKF
jgi:hypothetical protein